MGVVAVVAHQVEPGCWNVHQQPVEELGGVEGLAAASWRSFVVITGKPRLEGEALERQGRPQQVAGKPLEAAVIVGSNGDRIVG